MTNVQTQKIWSGIVQVLEDKLQYGFLKQLESVVHVELAGGELTLFVTDVEAEDFFRADVNQQRLMIISRPLVPIDSIQVQKVDAEPLR